MVRPVRFEKDRWSVRGLALCAVLWLLAGASDSQATVLRGRVADAENDEPLAGVSLQLQTPDGVQVLGLPKVTSAADGRFVWATVPAAVYRLEWVAEGYETDTMPVDLTAGEPVVLELTMTSLARGVEVMVVIGEASDMDQDIQTGYVKLDRETLSEVPSVIEDDPLRALQILPGVQAASDISSGLYVRGGGPDQTLVLMEGVTVYNPTHAFGFFSTFNNDAVKDLTLYKGAYPAAYGGRLGGLLDVEMVRDTSPEVSGKVGLSVISGRIYLEGRAGPDQWWGAARRSFLEPLLEAIDTPEQPIPSWYFYDSNFGYTTERGGGTTRFTFYKGRDQVTVDADVNTGLTLGWGNTVAQLRHERFLGDTFEASLSLSHSRYDSRTDAEILATEFDVINRLTDTTLASRLDWWAGQHHHVQTGVSYSWYDFRYQQEFNLASTLDYGSQPGELAVFAEDRWYADDLSTVRGGLRFRHLPLEKRSLWEPRMSLSRQVRPDLRLKLGGGIYHQYLQLVSTEGFSSGDFYVPIDETADPGRSWQLVAGAEWQADEQTEFSLEVFNTGLENLVALDSNVPVDQNSLVADELFVTDGKGYARGIEVFVRHKRESWTGWLGYTMGWTRRTFAELNGGESFVPKYDRRHDLNLLVARQAGQWKLSASFRFATGQAFTPAAARYQLPDPATGQVDDEQQILSGARNSGRLLPYHRLDVSARHPLSLLGLKGEFVAEIFNLYNRRNEWFVQYDTDESVTEASVVGMLPLIPSVGVNFEF